MSKTDKGRPIEYVSDSAAKSPHFYANNVAIDITGFDLRLRFGQLHEARPEVLTVREQCAIYMSYEHANALLDGLQKAIAARKDLKIEVNESSSLSA